MNTNQQNNTEKGTVIQDNIVYSINDEDKTAVIIGNDIKACSIIIPYSINYKSEEYIIKKIASKSFAHTSVMLQSIEFHPESKLEIIESYAFEYSYIQSISIPAHLVKIDDYAFSNCHLTKINIPKNSNLQTIGNCAFYDTILPSIEIPPKLMELKERCFENAPCLKNITIMPGNATFQKLDKFIVGKSSPEKVDFDLLLRYIDDNTKNVKIPDSIEVIFSDVFKYFNGIKIEIPDTSKLRVIGNSSFYEASIESITLPRHVTKICDSAFYECEHLKNVEIPNDSQLKEIGKSAFFRVPITSLFIPSQLTTIDEYAFHQCPIVHIKIAPNSKLQSIGSHAFDGIQIEKFDLPPSVTYIGAFDIENLREFNIPENSELKTVNSGALQYTNIEKFTIPSKFEIGDGEFINFPDSLKKIEIMPDNPYFKLFDDKYLLMKSSLEKDDFDVLVYCYGDIEILNIPDSVEIINGHIFNDPGKVKHIEFSKNSKLRVIKENAFASTLIESINIPQHLVTIGRCAFRGCYKLKDFHIPENSELQEIGAEIIDYTLVEKFVIPSKLTKLHELFALFAEKLKEIEVMDGNKNFVLLDDKILIGKSSPEKDVFDKIIYAIKNIKCAHIPDYIEIISQDAFVSCKFLQKVEISNKSRIRIIGDGAFANTAISEFNYPQNLIEIGERAFAVCKFLKKFDIPENSKLQKIGDKAFDGDQITSFIIPAGLSSFSYKAFLNCFKLQIVEINENSTLDNILKEFVFFKDKYYDDVNLIIMIPVKM